MSDLHRSDKRHYTLEGAGVGTAAPEVHWPPGRQQRRSTAWGSQLRTFTLLATFALGIGGAIGHHFWYSHFEGRRAEDQAWVVRGGTAIAFVVKLLFSASIGVGFAQAVWRKLRQKPYSLGAIDSLFTLRDNPLSFLSGEVLLRAKLCAVIAAMSWALALVPILVPASISVRPDNHAQMLDPMPILTLNFSKPVMEVRYKDGIPVSPVQLGKHFGMGAPWESYQKPTAAATGLILNTLYGKRLLATSSPCGANCSFDQTFVGPAYKCDDIDFMTTTNRANPFCSFSNPPTDPSLGTCGGFFLNAGSTRALDGISWYRASNSSGFGPGPTWEGWQDGKLWVAHQSLQPSYRPLFDDAGRLKDTTTEIPVSAFDRRMFVCQSYNATYTITRAYQNFQQLVTGNVSYINPINFTTLLPAERPTPHAYAGFAIHQVLFSFLSGVIGPNGRSVLTDTTGLATSALVEEVPFPALPPGAATLLLPPPQKPVLHLREAIEQLHFNITVGLLSMGPSLLYAENGTTAGSVKSSTTEIVWAYEPLVLLAVYAAAAAVDLCVIGVGVWAMVRNGGTSGFEFARVVAATREMDRRVTEGWEDGLDPVPEGVERTKVRYGMVVGRGGGGGGGEGETRMRAGFGYNAEVGKLR